MAEFEGFTLTISDVMVFSGMSLGSVMWTSCSSATIHGKSWGEPRHQYSIHSRGTWSGWLGRLWQLARAGSKWCVCVCVWGVLGQSTLTTQALMRLGESGTSR